MAITSGFFDSVDKDRLYNSAQISECFDGIVSDGIFDKIGNCFEVKASVGGMKLSVGSGRAIVSGHWIKNDSEYIVEFDAADSTCSRIDSIVIVCDLDTAVRACAIEVKKGIPSAVPSAPAPEISDTKKEMIIANILIPANATSILKSYISDMRDTSYCGYARLQVGLSESAATDKSYKHIQAVPADQWQIAHNLGKYPSVTVIDSSGNTVFGKIEYPDENNITLIFSAAFSGTAYLN